MWKAATSGTSNASQRHIHEGVHLSKVTLRVVDPYVQSTVNSYLALVGSRTISYCIV